MLFGNTFSYKVHATNWQNLAWCLEIVEHPVLAQAIHTYIDTWECILSKESPPLSDLQSYLHH